MSSPIATIGGEVGQPGLASLGDLTFRIAPEQISIEYHLDTAVIDTIGGRVIQVYGATLSDITVRGLFGRTMASDPSGALESSDLAKNFANEVALMVAKQGERPSTLQLTRQGGEEMNKPFRFTYTGDGVHQWDFDVYIKALVDPQNPNFTITHSTGKFSYGYQLTLFIVEDHVGDLTQVATDNYIERISKGLGWKKTIYNGPMSTEELKAYLATNSPDGTIHGLVLKRFEDASRSSLPKPGESYQLTPGGAATAGQAVDAAEDAEKPLTGPGGSDTAEPGATTPTTPP